MSLGLNRDVCLPIVGLTRNQFYYSSKGTKPGKGVSNHTIWRNPKTKEEQIIDNAEVVKKIVEIKLNPDLSNWYRLITISLNISGYYINHKKVYRLMFEYLSIRSPKRFSKLCYWLIDNGIMPVFSDPGCPQQNGRHERMHKDLKAYCKYDIQNTLSKQQEVMDRFRLEYNQVRPHESLDMKTPNHVHVKSIRQYSEKILQYDYPLHFRVTKVCVNGAARWGAYNWLIVSNAAKGRYVGAEEIGNGIWNVYYRDVLLGYFDEKGIKAKETYLHINKLKV